MNNTSHKHSFFFFHYSKLKKINCWLEFLKKVPLVYEGINYHTQPLSITLTAIHYTDPHGPTKTGAFAEQGSRKKFSILLVSLKNLKFLRYSPSLYLAYQTMVHKLGLLWMDSEAIRGSTEATHSFLSYKKFSNKWTNKKVKSQKAAEMQAACINRASNNVPCLKEKGPLLPCAKGPLLCPSATRHPATHLQHKFCLPLLPLPA